MILHSFAIYRGESNVEFTRGYLYEVGIDRSKTLWITNNLGVEAIHSMTDIDFVFLFNVSEEDALTFKSVLRKQEEEPATPDEIRQEIKDSMEEGDYLGAVVLQHEIDAITDAE